MTLPQTKKISPLAKWLAAGLSAFMFAYGVFVITTEHYYGRTSKLGGAEFSADGLQAIIIGIGIVVMGLLPMSLWAKSAKAAGIWAAACLVAGLVLIIGAPLFAH